MTYREQNPADLINRVVEQDREIERLRDELRQEKKVTRTVKREKSAAKIKSFLRKGVIIAGLVLAGLGLSGGIGFPIYKAATAPSQPEFCYLVHMGNWGPNDFCLFGSRPWAEDNYYGCYPSTEMALEIAEILYCPMSPPHQEE